MSVCQSISFLTKSISFLTGKSQAAGSRAEKHILREKLKLMEKYNNELKR